MECNPERDQDRAFDTYDHFKRFGKVMFEQQRTVYSNIARRCDGKSVLVAGCGAGVGAAMIQRYAPSIVATDKLQSNVDFSRELYPWIMFDTWDICTPFRYETFDSVVAVEVIEHVVDVRTALYNLMRSSRAEVWISTPNGNGKPRPPENPFHVREYRVDEMLEMINDEADVTVEVLDWQTFTPCTQTDPLVYHITK